MQNSGASHGPTAARHWMVDGAKVIVQSPWRPESGSVSSGSQKLSAQTVDSGHISTGKTTPVSALTESGRSLGLACEVPLVKPAGAPGKSRP